MNKFYLWLAEKCLRRVKPQIPESELIDTTFRAIHAARRMVRLMRKHNAPEARVFIEQDMHHLNSKQWEKYEDSDGWIYLESHGSIILDKEKGILAISVNY